MLRIWLDGVSLATPIRVDKCDSQKVGIRHGMCVRDTKGIFQDGLDRAPYVDDLETLLEQLFCFVREMVRDALLGGCVGLVDMYSTDWTTELYSGALVFGLSAGRVIEHKDARSPSTVETSQSDSKRLMGQFSLTHPSTIAPSPGSTRP